jgi:hypothetical protein
VKAWFFSFGKFAIHAHSAGGKSLDGHSALKGIGTVLHDFKAHTIATGRRGVVILDAVAIVGDRELALEQVQIHPDLVGITVFDGILDRLLGDAEEVDGFFYVEPLGAATAFHDAFYME